MEKIFVKCVFVANDEFVVEDGKLFRITDKFSYSESCEGRQINTSAFLESKKLNHYDVARKEKNRKPE